METVPGEEPVWTLTEVTKEEFENLLWVYYNPWVPTCSHIENYYAPVAVWRNLLKLAELWEMDQIQRTALNHLVRAEQSAIEKIKLCGRPYLGRYRARDAYIKICTREEALSPTEFQELGMDLVLLIMQIRERILVNRQGVERVKEEDIVDDMIGRWPDQRGPAAPDPEYC
ncbi:hypothetical protein C8R45DRAFT_849494 [Mycena sanguinolenta]|nr:hypothetical protein C8R45DRAFT_849494 [Mycena sanguinolenta]